MDTAQTWPCVSYCRLKYAGLPALGAPFGELKGVPRRGVFTPRGVAYSEVRCARLW